MRDRIRVNGILYESMSDHLNDSYLPKRDDIIEDIDDAIDDLKEIYKEDLTPAAKKDKKLRKMFAEAAMTLTSLRDYIRSEYTTVDRIG